MCQSIAEALEADGISVRLLRAREVREDVLRQVAALVVPGENAWVQWQTLGQSGPDPIHEFVRAARPRSGPRDPERGPFRAARWPDEPGVSAA